jgi:hypothetical protein
VILAVGINPLSGIKDAVSGTADSFLTSIGTAFCNMAADLSASVFSFAAQKSAVDLRADYVVQNYNIVFGVSILVVTGLFLCACIMGAVRGDPHLLIRALASTGTAIIGSFVALTLLQMVLAASDGVADAFGDGAPLGQSLVADLRALPEQGNFALDMVLSLFVALFSFVLFVVLYLRKIAIIVVAVFIPLYLAGQPTMSTSQWLRRATEILVALILTKPVIYAIFSLGAGMASELSGSATDQTLSILSGIVVMIAASISPLLLLQVFGFADVHLMRGVGGASRRGAASFGQGAGALLGSTSRDTMRGIGARLQTRNRGVLGGATAGGALPSAPVTAGRATVRAGRGGGAGAPARTGGGVPARASTAPRARVSRPSTTTAVTARSGRPASAGATAAASQARTPVRATLGPPPRPGRATTSASSTSHTASPASGRVSRPPVTPPARPTVPGNPARRGS